MLSEKQAIISYIQEYILQYDDNTQIDIQELELLINSKFYTKVDLEFIEKQLVELSKIQNAPLKQIHSIYGFRLFYRQNRIQRIQKHYSISRQKMINV